MFEGGGSPLLYESLLSAASSGIKFIRILSATIESSSQQVKAASTQGRATQQPGDLSPGDFEEDLYTVTNQ